MTRLPNWLTLAPDTVRSRTFWSGVSAIATALATLSGTERMLGVIAGLAVIFLRDAVAQTPPPKE